MTQFLKLYPGDKDYKEVSEREWDAPLEFPDVDGWGNPLTLTADVRVWDRPGGKLLVAKKWQSKSFIRNMARIMRNFYSNSDVQVFNIVGTGFTTQLNTSGSGQGGLVPNRDFMFGTGAAVAVGDGVAILDHQRNDLVSRVGSIYIASDAVSTLVDSSATLTFQITQGITIAQSGGITAREIALFLNVRSNGAVPTNVEGTATLVGYDGITATPVAQGGVIAPRYTLDFPV